MQDAARVQTEGRQLRWRDEAGQSNRAWRCSKLCGDIWERCQLESQPHLFSSTQKQPRPWEQITDGCSHIPSGANWVNSSRAPRRRALRRNFLSLIDTEIIAHSYTMSAQRLLCLKITIYAQMMNHFLSDTNALIDNWPVTFIIILARVSVSCLNCLNVNNTFTGWLQCRLAASTYENVFKSFNCCLVSLFPQKYYYWG